MQLNEIHCIFHAFLPFFSDFLDLFFGANLDENVHDCTIIMSSSSDQFTFNHNDNINQFNWFYLHPYW